MVLEASIENYLDDEVKRIGGITLKLNPVGCKGIPDRLVILDGFIGFVELKRPKGGVLARLQHYWYKWLTKRGHSAEIINTKELVDDYLRRHSNPQQAAAHVPLGDTKGR